MRNRINPFIRLVWALFFTAWSGQLTATDLEAAPDRDTGDIDNAADSFSVEDIPRVKLLSIEAEIVLDGVLDEPFWADAEVLSITTELYPERFAEAVVETRARVITTPTHLYIGFEAEDPDVSKIRSADRERDSVKDGDYVSLVIDPTGQLRRKFECRINPHGSRADILQDTISDRYWYDWDTRWEASAAFGENGYTAEMAIPLDSIKQPRLREGEEPFWLVVLKRSYPREVDKTFGSVFIFKRELTDTERSHRRRVELQPYYI